MRLFWLKWSSIRSELRPVNWALWLGLFTFSAIVNFLYVYVAYPMGIGVIYRLSAWLSAQFHMAFYLALIAGLADALGRKSRTLATFVRACAIVGALIYAANYLYYNIQNVHLNYGIAILTEGGLSRVLDNIRVSGISQAMAWVYSGVVAGMFITGALIARSTERLAARMQWQIYGRNLLLIGLVGLVGLSLEQGLGLAWKKVPLWAREQSAMPLYLSLIDAERASLWGMVPIKIRDLKTLDQRASALLQPVTPSEKRAAKPHLFLILLESFRADAISPETSPNLWTLNQKGTTFPLTYANANATHNSWWSIFHGRLPFEWNHARRLPPPQPGSPWLQWFRNAGYRVQVFCQPVINLKYFDFGKLIYGEDLGLASSIFRSNADLISPESDRILVQALLDSLKNKAQWETPTLTILYLDGAHFNYSWGHDFTPPFKPFSDDLDLTTLPYQQGGLQLIHNRYKNAVAYVDHLYGQLEAGLKAAGLYDSVGMAITGDHGEEFLEHGAFLHSHTLYDELIRTPILLKLPKSRRVPVTSGMIASQIHLFPTLADLAGMDETRIRTLEGRSLLRPDARHRYALSSAVYKTQAPYRYVLSNGRYKLFFDLNRDHPEKTKLLQIRKFTTLDDVEWLKGKRPSYEETLNFFDREFAPHLREVGFIEAVQGQ